MRRKRTKTPEWVLVLRFAHSSCLTELKFSETPDHPFDPHRFFRTTEISGAVGELDWHFFGVLSLHTGLRANDSVADRSVVLTQYFFLWNADPPLQALPNAAPTKPPVRAQIPAACPYRS